MIAGDHRADRGADRRAGGRRAAALAVRGLGAVLVLSTLVRLPACATERLDSVQRSVVDAVREDPSRSPAEAAAFVDEHLGVLLSSPVANALDDGDLARLFDRALAHEVGRRERLDALAAAVADEGPIHSEELSVEVAEAIAGDVAWIEDRVTAAYETQPGRATEPGDPEGTRIRSRYLDVHDLVREVTGDDEARATFRTARDEHAVAVVSSLPPDGLERELRLASLSRMLWFVDTAMYNAARGEALRSGDADAQRAASTGRAEQLLTTFRQLCGWLVAARFDLDPAIRADAAGRSFVDERGSLVEPMTPRQREAFHLWASTIVEPGQLMAEDYTSIGRGETQWRSRMELDVRPRIRQE